MANEVVINVKAKDVNATSTMNRIEGNTKKTSASVKAAWAVAGGAVGKFIGDTIMKSSDLNETMNKSQVIFGKHAAGMTKWASTAAEDMGLSKNAALQASAGFALMFQQLGSTGGESVKLSKNVVKLATDLGSFHNLDTADVMDRISAAFRGEYDSLQQLVPTINAARVQKEALAMTGKKNADSLTDEEKAMAALKIITEESKSAQDDFKETQDGLANTLKTLKARFEDWQSTAAGEETLAQLADDATTAMDAFIELTSALEDVGDGLETLKAGSGGGVSELGDEFIRLKAVVLDSIADMVEAASTWIPWLRKPAAELRKTADAADKEYKRVLSAHNKAETDIRSKPIIAKLKADKKDADTKIASVKKQLADPKLTATKRAKLEAKIDQLLRAKRQAQAAIDGLHGKTVRLSAYWAGSAAVAKARAAVGRGQTAFAQGGNVGAHAAEGGPRSDRVLVGEQGPELVDLPMGSHVNSNPDSQRLMASGGGRGGGDMHFHFHGPVYGDHNALRRALVNMKRSGQLDVVLR